MLVIIPSLVLLAVIPVIMDASAGTVRRLGRDWKDVEIPVDSGPSLFILIHPGFFLPFRLLGVARSRKTSMRPPDVMRTGDGAMAQGCDLAVLAGC